MKFLYAIILLSIGSLTVAEEDYVKAANYLETCFHNIGLSDEGEETLTDRQNKCGIACMFIALKLFNEDGSINFDEVLSHSKTLSAEKLKEYVKICEREGGYNAKTPEYACEIAACFQKKDFFSDLD